MTLACIHVCNLGLFSIINLHVEKLGAAFAGKPTNVRRARERAATNHADGEGRGIEAI
jgi:hypothetical protein